MRVTLCFILITLLCQACGPTTKTTAPGPEEAEAGARQLIVAGNYLAAADEYVRLAEQYPQQAFFFQLRTADSLILAGETTQAEDILNQVTAKRPQDDAYRKILFAELAVKKNQPETALAGLQNTPATGLPGELLSRLHRVRAKAYEGSFNFISAVEQRLQLDSVLLDPVEKRENAQQIWANLNRIKTPVLRELRTSSPLELSAWIELALIYQTMLFKPGLLEQAVSSWSEQYPDHLANSVVTSELLVQSKDAVLQPQHIALLLPLGGQYEKAAHAIRDGFLAAWYRQQTGKPQVSIYDANSLNIDVAYRQAVANGADFIVGPLEKKAIEKLVKERSIEIPTLALNHIDDTNYDLLPAVQGRLPKLIQFGLSPEDEARQAAEKGIFDGHNRALVITPDNDWGQRLASAFSETWTSLGGTILEYVNYNQRTKDYATPVKKILNLDSSQLRAARLRQKLNRALKSEPRLREDADMIFMAAVPLSARQIVPQFRFFQASDIPVYASSHSHSGITNAQIDSDMNGIMFIDIPAILSEENRSSAIAADIDRSWSASSSNYRRLYALGIDAFRVIPHIGKMSLQRTAQYKGETGQLSMDDRGRINRKLVWARFVNGRPRPLTP